MALQFATSMSVVAFSYINHFIMHNHLLSGLFVLTLSVIQDSSHVGRKFQSFLRGDSPSYSLTCWFLLVFVIPFNPIT